MNENSDYLDKMRAAGKEYSKAHDSSKEWTEAIVVRKLGIFLTLIESASYVKHFRKLVSRACTILGRHKASVYLILIMSGLPKLLDMLDGESDDPVVKQELATIKLLYRIEEDKRYQEDHALFYIALKHDGYITWCKDNGFNPDKYLKANYVDLSSLDNSQKAKVWLKNNVPLEPGLHKDEIIRMARDDGIINDDYTEVAFRGIASSNGFVDAGEKSYWALPVNV